MMKTRKMLINKSAVLPTVTNKTIIEFNLKKIPQSIGDNPLLWGKLFNILYYFLGGAI